MSNEVFKEFSKDMQRRDEFRLESERWILKYEPHFTHAVTLTFNHTKVRRQMMHIDPSLTLKSQEMIDLYKANMRSFKWRLVKSLYGNAYKRYDKHLVWIPILEGLGCDQKPHYHCMLGVTRDRYEGLEDKVHALWSDVPFGGTRVDIQTYTSSGWARYATKNALFLNRESIDWENVLVP